MKRFGEKGPKGHFWAKMAKFWPKMAKTGFFGQKLKSSHFDHYWCPTSWEVSEKTNEAFSRKTPDWHAEFIGSSHTSVGNQQYNYKSIRTGLFSRFIQSECVLLTIFQIKHRKNYHRTARMFVVAHLICWYCEDSLHYTSLYGRCCAFKDSSIWYLSGQQWPFSNAETSITWKLDQ